MIDVGIDIGSISTKAAFLEDGSILQTHVIQTGYNPEAAARKVFKELLHKSGCLEKNIRAAVSTGYGRALADFTDKAVTEIICHGTGAHFLNPDVRGVIDIGGQDSKAILLDPAGRVENFAMNDKCAAGTGRFLEVMANALEIDLDDLGHMGLKSENPSRISSICTVFAESEVISLLAGREKRENIVAGIHESAAAKVAALALRAGIKAPVMLTGGVARNKGMKKAIENILQLEMIVGKYAQETGAVGAAVLASRLVKTGI